MKKMLVILTLMYVGAASAHPYTLSRYGGDDFIDYYKRRDISKPCPDTFTAFGTRGDCIRCGWEFTERPLPRTDPDDRTGTSYISNTQCKEGFYGAWKNNEYYCVKNDFFLEGADVKPQYVVPTRQNEVYKNAVISPCKEGFYRSHTHNNVCVKCGYMYDNDVNQPSF